MLRILSKTLLCTAVIAIFTVFAATQAEAVLSCNSPCTDEQKENFTCAEDLGAGYRGRVVFLPGCDQFPCLDPSGNSVFKWDICKIGGKNISHVDIAFDNNCNPPLQEQILYSDPLCGTPEHPLPAGDCVEPLGYDPSTGFDIGRTLTDVYKWKNVDRSGDTISLTFSQADAVHGPMLVKAGKKRKDWGQLELLVPTCPETPVPQQEETSVQTFIQTDPGTNPPATEKTCEISIDEGKLPAEGAVTVRTISGYGECTFNVELAANFTLDGKQITTIAFYEWIATHSSPGQFTYCFPSGYCIVFTF